MTDRPTGIDDTDVYMTRAFDAPRELVWRFWTEPELISTWFGPTSTHTPVDKIDVEMRPGGAWNITMVDNETGAEYPIRGRVLEVERPVYFLVEQFGDVDQGFSERMQLRVEFHDHGERTRVTLHQGPFTAEFRDMTVEGWEESFVRMDGALA